MGKMDIVDPDSNPILTTLWNLNLENKYTIQGVLFFAAQL
jgi:hypothetical protein